MGVIYDHREERSVIPGLLELAGIEVISAQLPVGDYLISDRLAIERKSGNDLVASIKDGRLFEQAGRLRESYERPVLILEGEPQRFPVESWKGALASLIRQGVAVLAVRDAHEAAQWIGRFVRQEESSGRPRVHGAPKPRDPDRLSLTVAAALPGVSATGARRLLEHFGSLRALFAADSVQLREVEGIGRKRALQIVELLERGFEDKPF